MVDRPMLIVGGGIAGLSLRLALRGSPWEVELVERNAGSDQPGAGLAVQPNAMRVLRTLGVAEAVEAAGAIVVRFEYRDRQGELLCAIDLRDLWGEVGPFVGVTRRALHEALGSTVGRCRSGRSAVSVHQQDGRVHVAFDDATAAYYALVVGADGVHSRTRTSAVTPAGPVYAGQMAWRSLAPVGCGTGDTVQFFLGTDRFFGLCPVGDEVTYGFGNVTCGRLYDPVAGRKRRLAGRFADFGPPVQEYIAAIRSDEDIHPGPISWYPDIAWHNGRVVLIGDAAHAMSPMMGQGGCMAVEDSLVLAEELCRHGDVATALTAFTERRAPRVAWVRDQSQALGELVGLPAEIRDRALRTHGTAAFHDRYRPLVAAP
jgi:2-polyprenyl-6-methoxyphenol hydroxylase-like FAD-dependent oxidoreductase